MGMCGEETYWRGGRAVDRAGLENQYGLRVIGGSNPPLSVSQALAFARACLLGTYDEACESSRPNVPLLRELRRRILLDACQMAGRRSNHLMVMHAPGTTTLLDRLREGANSEDWRTLVERYWRQIYAFGRRRGLEQTDAEDFTQDILIELTRILPDFEYDRGRGEFRSFLLTLCQRRLIDRLRARKEPPTTAVAAEQAADDEVVWWKREWQRSLLRACLDEAARAVEPRTFQAFQLVVIEEWPAKQAAAFLEMSVDSVYQAKARVLRRARAAFEARQRGGGNG